MRRGIEVNKSYIWLEDHICIEKWSSLMLIRFDLLFIAYYASLMIIFDYVTIVGY